MAEEETSSYEDILEYYYTGTSLADISVKD
jgi:peptidoglycan hydrolase-like amidase